MSKLTRDQIKSLITNFYSKVSKDDLLDKVFNDVAQVSWEHHIPLLCTFWNSIMLGTHEYHGNALEKHLEISKKTLITNAHFDRWLTLFRETAEIELSTEDAKEIIERASMIASALKRVMLGQRS